MYIAWSKYLSPVQVWNFKLNLLKYVLNLINGG